MSRPYRIQAKMPGQCSCGASFEEDDDVLWDPEDRRIVGCPDCDWTGQAKPAKADLKNVRGGGRGVAAGIRRRREKEAKARAKEKQT